MASEAYDEVHDLLVKADIPAVHTLMATGIMRYDDEHNLGLVGIHGMVAANKAINEADLIIALGARFSDRVAQDPKKWGHRAKIIQVDIDISEIGKNVAVDMSCVGDVKDFLQRSLPQVNKAEHSEWRKACAEWKKSEKTPPSSSGSPPTRSLNTSGTAVITRTSMWTMNGICTVCWTSW